MTTTIPRVRSPRPTPRRELVTPTRQTVRPVRAVSRRLPLSRTSLILYSIGLVDSIGTGLYLAGSVVYFTSVLGLSTTRIGVGLSVAGLVGLVAQKPIGRLADLWGPQRVLIALHLWRAAGFASYLLVGDFTAFLVVVAMLGVGEQATYPVYQAFVERVVGGTQRVDAMARVRVVYNTGFTIGAVLAGAAVAVGSRGALDLIMVGNALSFVICAALLARTHMMSAQEAGLTASATGIARLRPLRDPPYVAAALLNGVLSLHMTLLAVAIPLLVTTKSDAPRAMVGVLLVVNTVMAVLLQVRVARGCDSVAGSVTALTRAGAFLAGAAVLFALTPLANGTEVLIPLLVLGLIALTAGELLQSAGGWGLSYSLAPSWSRAEYLATFNLGTSLQFVFGPALLTVGVVNRGPLGWCILAAGFLVTGLAIRPLARAAAERPVLVARRYRP